MKITKYIRLYIGLALLLALSSCDQNQDNQIQNTLDRPGPMVSIEMASSDYTEQSNSEELKGLNFKVDNINTIPSLMHNEPKVTVHCYFRSTDPTQPVTYLPLEWNRVKDEQGRYTNKLVYSTKTLNLAAGTNLNQGQWFVTGIIGNADSEGNIQSDPHYFVNLSDQIANGSVQLDIPFAFPWTKLNINGTSLGKITVRFKPVGTILRFSVENKGNSTYRVRGFDFETSELSMPNGISPKDPSSPAPEEGVYPEPKFKREGYRQQFGLSVNPSFTLSGQSQSPTFLFWTLGKPKTSSEKFPIHIHMRHERINEFGQRYQRRTLIDIVNKGYYAGYKYNLSTSVEDAQKNTLSHLTEHSLLSNLNGTSLSFDPNHNSYANYYNLIDYGVFEAVSTSYDFDERTTGDKVSRLSSSHWLFLLMPFDISWDETINRNLTISNSQHSFASFPGTESMTSIRSSILGRGDGIIYITRDGGGNQVGEHTFSPTAIRLQFIDNPYGQGKALLMMARLLSSSEDINTISSETWWWTRPSRNVVRLLPAMGYQDHNGQTIGLHEDLYLYSPDNNAFGSGLFGTSSGLFLINSEGIKLKDVTVPAGTLVNSYLMHGKSSTSGAFGD